MYVDWQTLITAGAVAGAVTTLLGLLLKGHKWVLKQNRQDEKLLGLERHHKEDVQHIKEENCLICFALAACLDGLQQLGCNHTVPEAKRKLDKYLNQQAHE